MRSIVDRLGVSGELVEGIIFTQKHENINIATLQSFGEADQNLTICTLMWQMGSKSKCILVFSGLCPGAIHHRK